MEGGAHRQQQRPLGPPAPWRSRPPARPPRGRPRPPPGPDRCRWPPRRPRPCAASAATASAVARSSPSSAAIAPCPTGTASCIACPRSRSSRAVSARLSEPAAQSAEYSPSECPATKAAEADRHALGLERAHRGERGRHQRRLGVAGQGELGRVALPDQGGELLAERGVDLVEDRPRGRKGLGEVAPHADDLGALPGKHECPRHDPSLALFSRVRSFLATAGREVQRLGISARSGDPPCDPHRHPPGRPPMPAPVPSRREILARLVGFPTVSAASNLDLVAWVRRSPRHATASPPPRVPDPGGDKAGLVATVGPADRPGAVLSAHTDVVPVEGQPWTSDPFVLTERDGRLYGRGTTDMKGFVACALHAALRRRGAAARQPAAPRPLLGRGDRLRRGAHAAAGDERPARRPGASASSASRRRWRSSPATRASRGARRLHRPRRPFGAGADGAQRHPPRLRPRRRAPRPPGGDRGGRPLDPAMPFPTPRSTPAGSRAASRSTSSRTAAASTSRSATSPPTTPPPSSTASAPTPPRIVAAEAARFPEAAIAIAVTNAYPGLDTDPASPTVALVRALAGTGTGPARSPTAPRPASSSRRSACPPSSAAPATWRRATGPTSSSPRASSPPATPCSTASSAGWQPAFYSFNPRPQLTP